jgi:hypothetical protein
MKARPVLRRKERSNDILSQTEKYYLATDSLQKITGKNLYTKQSYEHSLYEETLSALYKYSPLLDYNRVAETCCRRA